MKILLTAALAPSKVFFQNHEKLNNRLDEYIDTVNFYLNNTSLNIDILSGGYNCYYLKEKILERCGHNYANKNRLKFYFYPESIFEYESGGKGRSEFYMIDCYFSSLKSNEPIIKITGRYKIINIKKIIQSKLNSSEKNFIILLPYLRKYIDTSIFIIDKKSYYKYMHGNYVYCNDSNGFYIEHILYKKISSKLILKRGNSGFKYYPIIIVGCNKFRYGARSLIVNLAYFIIAKFHYLLKLK